MMEIGGGLVPSLKDGLGSNDVCRNPVALDVSGFVLAEVANAWVLHLQGRSHRWIVACRWFHLDISIIHMADKIYAYRLPVIIIRTLASPAAGVL